MRDTTVVPDFYDILTYDTLFGTHTHNKQITKMLRVRHSGAYLQSKLLRKLGQETEGSLDIMVRVHLTNYRPKLSFT